MFINRSKKCIFSIKPSLQDQLTSVRPDFATLSTINKNTRPTGARFQHSQATPNQQLSQRNFLDIVQEKFKLANEKYETAVGISDIRHIQDEVLKAEANFMDIRKERKLCQDQVDKINNRIKEVWDKLDSTSRSSETYIELRTNEYKLVKEQSQLDARLIKLKDHEQASFDDLSRLLRRSHEQERLRQERSKTFNLLSLGLSAIIVVFGRIFTRDSNIEALSKTLDEKLLKPINVTLDSISNNIAQVSNESKIIQDEIVRNEKMVDKRLAKLERDLKGIQDKTNNNDKASNGFVWGFVSTICSPGYSLYKWLIGYG